MARSQFPLLKVGEIVMLIDGGPQYRVTRVTAGAAYLKPRYAVAKEVTVKGRTFEAHEGGSVVAVSPRAAVYRIEG